MDAIRNTVPLYVVEDLPDELLCFEAEYENLPHSVVTSHRAKFVEGIQRLQLTRDRSALGFVRVITGGYLGQDVWFQLDQWLQTRRVSWDPNTRIMGRVEELLALFWRTVRMREILTQNHLAFVDLQRRFLALIRGCIVLPLDEPVLARLDSVIDYMRQEGNDWLVKYHRKLQYDPMPEIWPEPHSAAMSMEEREWRLRGFRWPKLEGEVEEWRLPGLPVDIRDRVARRTAPQEETGQKKEDANGSEAAGGN
jgi:hypothetical protein